MDKPDAGEVRELVEIVRRRWLDPEGSIGRLCDAVESLLEDASLLDAIEIMAAQPGFRSLTVGESWTGRMAATFGYGALTHRHEGDTLREALRGAMAVAQAAPDRHTPRDVDQPPGGRHVQTVQGEDGGGEVMKAAIPIIS